MRTTAVGDTARPWPGIMPGDVFWDEGGGLIGLAIRIACLGSYAHCGVVTGPRDDETGNFATVEAYPGGVTLRHDRNEDRVFRAARLWRTEHERQAIVDEALSHVGRGYAYAELARIALWRFRIDLPVADNPATMICSNSVASALRAGRPDLRLSYDPDRIWPHRVLRDVAVQEWLDHRAAERAVKQTGRSLPGTTD